MLDQVGFCDLEEQVFDQLFSRMDCNGSGSVGFKEFCTSILERSVPSEGKGILAPGGKPMWQLFVKVSESQRFEQRCYSGALERIFGCFDRDGSGYIEEVELKLRLEGMGFDSGGTELLFRQIAGRRRKILKVQFFDFVSRLQG